MATYKVSREKVQKILKAVKPRLIFVNGPPGLSAVDFVNDFKKDGFGIINVTAITTIEQIKKRLDTFKAGPTIVWGQLVSVELISDMFKDYPVFSYVYLYPANSKQYVKNLVQIHQKLSKEDKKSFIREIHNYVDSTNVSNNINHLAKASLKKCVKIYKTHLEYFDHMLISLEN